MNAVRLAQLIRAVPDFPNPGVMFRDITPVLHDPLALPAAAEALAEPFARTGVDRVAAMEARGFIFGAMVAARLGAGFVPLRKPGKLPYQVRQVSYALEYGEATLEMHLDAVVPGERILVVDDVIATGGTAVASCELLEGAGADIVGCAFLIELLGLAGRARLARHVVHSVIEF